MATQISEKRKFVADAAFYAELNEVLARELADVVIIQAPKEDDVSSVPTQVVAPAALLPEAPLTAVDCPEMIPEA